MTKFTPFYNPDTCLDLYGRARELADLINAQPMLPWGQYANNEPNREIVRRHRALVAKAREVQDELRAITLELAEHARERQGA